MTNSRWQRIESIFADAVALDGEAQAEFLDDVCKDDEALRNDVEALLKADERNVGDGSSMPNLGKIASVDEKLINSVVGGWRIVEQLGTGGMGSVFLAERHDGEFEQQAALKIVRRGLDTDHVLQRFRLERQILARLNHPNIANLIDGGVTDDGRPFFAMEYVNGQPINEYCDRGRLSIDERLALFRIACDAVHYAHRNLVVHRDLKPSNILVTADGVVKLLDFGIAKLLDDEMDPRLTRTGMQVHTPAYAAPEQLTNGSVTTTTDVYALGVVLYELLSGRRPFEVRRTPEELRELVLTGDPPKPSTAVSMPLADTAGLTGRATGEEPGALRRAPGERLQKRLRGDLDIICLMAMHREPDHRYPSVDQMSADIGRHLDGLPVVASPDSLSYRLGKFYRRNKAAVIGTTSAIVAFIALSVFYTSQLTAERDRALDEQRKANEVVDFVVGLFQVSDPSESRGENVSARDLLDAGANRIDTELRDRPGVQALMRRVLGEVHYYIGAYERSRELLAAALQQQQALYGNEHLDVATTELLLAFHHQDLGEFDLAEPLYLSALETRRRLLGNQHQDVVEAVSALAVFEERRGNFDTAEQLYVEARDVSQRAFDGDHAFTAEAMTNLGGFYRFMERYEEAETLIRDALAMQERVYGGPHPEIDSTKRHLAGLLRDTGRYEDSRALYKSILASRVKMLGEENIEVANTWNSYSHLLVDMSEDEAALQANDNYLAIMERIHKGPHPGLGAAYNNRANMLEDNGDFAGAIEYYRRSIEMQDLTELPPRHINRTYPLSGLANVYRRQQRYAEAETAYRDVYAIRLEALGEDHTLVSETKTRLGQVLTGLGRYDEAEKYLLDAHDRFLAERGLGHHHTDRSAGALADLYELLGETGKAAEFRSRESKPRD